MAEMPSSFVSGVYDC